MTLEYVVSAVAKLTRRYRTRDPFELCAALGIELWFDDLGQNLKAFYVYESRERNIAVNNRCSEELQRVLVGHELCHDQEHRSLIKMKGFTEIDLFNLTSPLEYEANLYAAELLLDDERLLELMEDEVSFFAITQQMKVPPELLDLKYRLLKHKGYRIQPLYLGQANFLARETLSLGV